MKKNALEILKAIRPRLAKSLRFDPEAFEQHIQETKAKLERLYQQALEESKASNLDSQDRSSFGESEGFPKPPNETEEE